MKRVAAIFFISLLGFACRGQTEKGAPNVVGGCVVDTIKMNLKQINVSATNKSYTYIDILSLEFNGESLSRNICLELTAFLDSLDIVTLSRSDIIHVKSGPCWPPYRISFHVNPGDGDRLERAKKLLLATELTGYRAAAERPKGYGTFFITCRRADKDLWTVWYQGRQ
ncbi:hypothetical protein J7M07_02995 [bacterium]|nr:hypothetical protein [bacterium]